MMFSETERQLLRSSQDEEKIPDEYDAPYRHSHAQNASPTPLIRALVACLVVSVVLNAITSILLWHSPSVAYGANTRQGRISYSGLKYNVPTTYTYHSEYWNDSDILSEEKWESLSIDPAVIAVSPEWAMEKGLPPSWEFPWDRSKRMYFLKVFHQLHCLKSFRRAFESYEANGTSTIGHGHLSHCLESLRQDLMCHADDTPMPSPRLFHSLGDGQVNQCMDFEKLSAWALHPDRHACHKHIAEFDSITHSIERFAFCPPDSPYYPAMSAYFEKHGHKDPIS